MKEKLIDAKSIKSEIINSQPITKRFEKNIDSMRRANCRNLPCEQIA